MMRKRLPAKVKVSIFLIFLFILFLHLIFNHIFTVKPKIALLHGDVSLYSEKTGLWTKAVMGQELASGDVLKTGGNSFADIEERGKYTVRVKSNTELSHTKPLPKFIPGSVRYNTQKGKALVWIQKGFKGSKFKIKTPTAIIGARGTKFLIDISPKMDFMTRIGVLEGNVAVVSSSTLGALRDKEVMVEGGQATEVYANNAPLTPRELLDKEWNEMIEFYQIGKPAQVALLISDGINRTRELLRPCPLYISDVEPRTVSVSLEETIRIIDDAIKTQDKVKHLAGIKRLEQILIDYPNPSYEPQILLFTGAYYNYLGMYDEALTAFMKVFDTYPETTFASMALYASGIVYDEKMKDHAKAVHYYDLVLKNYPESPEARSIKAMNK